MQLIFLAIAFVLSFITPQSTILVTEENPLVSSYMRQDNTSTIGGKARLLRLSAASLELLYHRTLGAKFYVSDDVLFESPGYGQIFQGERSIWPNHTDPVVMGFYPFGRGMTGTFINVTAGARYDNSGPGTYEWQAGCRWNLKPGIVMKVVVKFNYLYRPVMTFEFAF